MQRQYFNTKTLPAQRCAAGAFLLPKGAELCPSCGRAPDSEPSGKDAATCSYECAASHWLTRNRRGFDYHQSQRGGVVSGIRRRERVRSRNSEWAGLYNQGMSMRQIAATWGVAPSTVSRVLREPLKRRPDMPVGTDNAFPPALAHTRGGPLDHVRAAQRRLNRLARGRGLRCEPARVPAPPLAVAARCPTTRPPWPPTIVTTSPARHLAAIWQQERVGEPTGTGSPSGRIGNHPRVVGDSAGVGETVGNLRQIGFSTEVVAQPFRRL